MSNHFALYAPLMGAALSLLPTFTTCMALLTTGVNRLWRGATRATAGRRRESERSRESKPPTTVHSQHARGRTSIIPPFEATIDG